MSSLSSVFNKSFKLISLKASEGSWASEKLSPWQHRAQDCIQHQTGCWLLFCSHWYGLSPRVTLMEKYKWIFNIIFSPMPITGNPFSIAQVYLKLWWNMHRSGLFHGAEGKGVFINLIAIFPSVQLSHDSYKPHHISIMLMWESQEVWQTGNVISRLTTNILFSYYGLFKPHILVFISKEMMRKGQLLRSFERENYRDAMKNNSVHPHSVIQGTIKERINIPGLLPYEKR